MPERPDRLIVWLGDTPVAELVQRRRTAPVRCRYTEVAIERWRRNVPLLSCSLPLTDRPQDATPFLAGLLPEGQHLATISARLGLASNDVFMLLAHLGRDVAGALVIATDDETFQHEPGLEPYGEHSLARAVERLPEAPLGIEDDSELSLAGLADKLLLVRTERGWARPIGGRPSTHILKVEDRRFPGLVRHEASCLRLARALDLTEVDVDVVTLGHIDCLIVSRFDRRIGDDGELTRIHQEDACQALGINPWTNRGRATYEEHGGPTYARVAQLLERHAGQPREQLLRLTRAITLTVLIGDADAHGKNIAFLHPEPGVVELAPLYDTVPTVLYPQLRRTTALSINGRFAATEEVGLRDVVTETTGWGLGESIVRDTVRSVAVATLDLVEQAGTEVTDEVRGHLRRRVPAFLAGDR